MNVDLPDPFMPSTALNMPGCIVRLMLYKMRWPALYEKLTLLTKNAAAPSHGAMIFFVWVVVSEQDFCACGSLGTPVAALYDEPVAISLLAFVPFFMRAFSKVSMAVPL